MNSRQAVIVAMFMSVGVFLLANANASASIVARVEGKPDTVDDTFITPRAAAAWATLFIVFVLLTDIPATQPVGAGFAWLFFLSILYKYGQAAFTTVTTMNTITAGTPAPVIRPPAAPAAKKP